MNPKTNFVLLSKYFMRLQLNSSKDKLILATKYAS